MGLSSSKTTSTSGPSAQALPYLQQGSSALQSAYAANQPNLQGVSDKLSGAFSRFDANAQNNPTTAAANNYVTSTLTQPYAANPELGNQIDQTNNDITDRINAIFSRSGQTGSSRQVGELGKQLANNESSLRYTDYNNWLQRQQAAVGSAAQLGGLDNQTAAAEAALGSAAGSVPYIGAQILSSGLGGLWGNSQTTTQKQSGNLFQSLLSAAASAGQAAAMGG